MVGVRGWGGEKSGVKGYYTRRMRGGEKRYYCERRNKEGGEQIKHALE